MAETAPLGTCPRCGKAVTAAATRAPGRRLTTRPMQAHRTRFRLEPCGHRVTGMARWVGRVLWFTDKMPLAAARDQFGA